jgi:hypothetical protein
MLRPLAWFIYPTLLLVLLLAALGRREHADSPPAPPPLPAPERAVLAETTPIDPAVVMRVRSKRGPDAGTAFSVGDGGVWLTARSSLAACAQPAVLVNDLEGVAARALAGPDGRIAVLITARGAPALSLAAAAPNPGALAFAPGFPHGRPGEVAAHLIGRRMLRSGARQAERTPILVWAEMGRTEGLTGRLTGLAGAPMLDAGGRVVGLVLAEAPRRGRLYAATPAELAAALAAAKAPRPAEARGATITSDDYGLAADALRRQLRVAPTACISR